MKRKEKAYLLKLKSYIDAKIDFELSCLHIQFDGYVTNYDETIILNEVETELARLFNDL